MRYKQIFNVVGVAAVSAFFCVGCGEKPDDVDGGDGDGKKPPVVTTFVDDRDGKTYKKVTIGNQTWMAENLNYAASESKCYGEGAIILVYDVAEDVWSEKTLSSQEVQANCEKYGRLYDWNTAIGGASSSSAYPSGIRGICPVGWHLPSDAEWDTLVTFIGGPSVAGRKLKSTSGWNNSGINGSVTNGNGTDDFGFSALPGGLCTRDGFVLAGNYGYWWSATVNDAVGDWMPEMSYDGDYVYRDNDDYVELLAVRCVKD